MNQTVYDKILEISDWRHPYRLEDGQEVQLSKSWYADWHRWRLRTEMSGLEAGNPTDRDI